MPRSGEISLGLCALLFLAWIPLSGGCRSEEPTERLGTPESNAPAQVDLPPVPELDVDRPVRYPDGSLSIWGLLQRRNELLGQPVRVTGVVTNVYICEWRAQQAEYDRMVELGPRYQPEGTARPLPPPERCNYPHLFIADYFDSERDLLVTGYPIELEQRLVVGERYLFEGRYMDETRGIVRAGVGLIWADNISGGSLDQEVPETDVESIQIQ